MNVLPIGKPFDFSPLLWDNSQLGMLSCDSQIRQASLNLAVKKEKCLGYITLIISAIFQSAPLFQRTIDQLNFKQESQSSTLLSRTCIVPRTINTNSSAILIYSSPTPKPKRTSPSLKILLPRLYPLLSFFYFFTVTSRSSLLPTPFSFFSFAPLSLNNRTRLAFHPPYPLIRIRCTNRTTP